eukprot:COSAG06_NODE_9142_length_1975_cov_3.842217_3_plen_220_part_00
MVLPSRPSIDSADLGCNQILQSDFAIRFCNQILQSDFAIRFCNQILQSDTRAYQQQQRHRQRNLTPFSMATPIRENCLDENDRPNENAARVQAALDIKGCMCINRPGGRCKSRVVFDAVSGLITCTATPKHTREAQDPPFGKIVFDVINAIERERMAVEDANMKQERQRFAERKAAEEALALGLTDYTVHARPDGPAPDGNTWSYSQGRWVSEDAMMKQ